MQGAPQSRKVFRKKVGVVKQLTYRQNHTWATNRSVENDPSVTFASSVS